MLKEALKTKRRRKEKVTLEIELTPQEYDKLELLARFHQKGSVAELVREVLEPKIRAYLRRTSNRQIQRDPSFFRTPGQGLTGSS